MSRSATPPKRLVVTYISYCAYMPNGPSGITDLDQPHHDWSWWPCRDPGPLTFNQSSAPFAPLKDRLSYLQGLDHAGGHSLGGHSSGDVFATGADMADLEKTNNISVDQVDLLDNNGRTETQDGIEMAETNKNTLNVV